jgi:putative peptidoglycan lipid II flippase
MAGKAWGIQALALGTVTGVLLEATLLGWGLKAQGMSLRPQWHGIDAHVRHVASQYGAMVASMLLMSSTLLVDRSMAAMLAPGSVAALNYGSKIVGAVSGIVAMALYTAVLPYFSHMVVKKDWVGCQHTLKTYSYIVLVVTVPLTLGLLIFSRPLVRILFERGAFTSTDTLVVSGIQALYAFQIPFLVLAIPFTRALSSLGANHLIMYGSALALFLDVVLNIIFIKFLGVRGIALSTSVVYLLLCVFLAIAAIRQLRRASHAA